jgi:hypothetical protein
VKGRAERAIIVSSYETPISLHQLCQPDAYTVHSFWCLTPNWSLAPDRGNSIGLRQLSRSSRRHRTPLIELIAADADSVRCSESASQRCAPRSRRMSRELWRSFLLHAELAGLNASAV